MANQLDIKLEQTAAGGRYWASVDGGPEAEMTYTRIDDTKVAFDHTYVPNEYRGQGIAEKLVLRGIADARENGDKIVPVCSYVVAQFRRHPEWADLKAER